MSCLIRIHIISINLTLLWKQVETFPDKIVVALVTNVFVLVWKIQSHIHSINLQYFTDSCYCLTLCISTDLFAYTTVFLLLLFRWHCSAIKKFKCTKYGLKARPKIYHNTIQFASLNILIFCKRTCLMTAGVS